MKTLSQYLAIAMMVILVATGAWAEPINCTYVPQFGAGSISRYPDEPVVCAGSTVTFTATIPTDNDTCDDDRKLYEDTVSVSWNFGDGNTGSGTPIEHQFTNAREVTLPIRLQRHLMTAATPQMTRKARQQRCLSRFIPPTTPLPSAGARIQHVAQA